MLTLIFIICMIAVFGKIAGLALRGAWGLTKILLSMASQRMMRLPDK